MNLSFESSPHPHYPPFVVLSGTLHRESLGSIILFFTSEAVKALLILEKLDFTAMGLQLRVRWLNWEGGWTFMATRPHAVNSGKSLLKGMAIHEYSYRKSWLNIML